MAFRDRPPGRPVSGSTSPSAKTGSLERLGDRNFQHCSYTPVRVSWENKIFDLTLPTLTTFVPRFKKAQTILGDFTEKSEIFFKPFGT